MKNKDSLLTSPQLENYEQHGALALSPKQIISLYKKSKSCDIPLEVLEQVYIRGYKVAGSEQAGFARVDSFIHGGHAADLDKDLQETVVQEPRTTDPDLPSSRFVGTPELTDILKSQTPGQQRAETIKRVVRDAINTKKDSAE